MADSFVFSNRAVATLQSAIDQFTNTAYISSDDVPRFPVLVGGSKFPIILSDREDNYEICYVVTLNESGEMTIERGKEDTAAQNWSAGTYVEHCLTAGSFLAAARLVPKGEWDEAVNYIPGDVVVYTDISYLAVASSLGEIPSGASAYWQILYQPQGVSSTALNWLGDWNSGITYAVGAYVKYQGRLFVAVAPGLNHLPTDTDFWYPLGTPPDAVTYDEVLTATGTNNYSVSPSTEPTALFDGMELSIIFPSANTTAATLTVSGLAPTPLRPKKSVEFGSGELGANSLFEFVYLSGTDEFVAKSAAVFEAVLAGQESRLDTIEAKTIPVGTVLDYAGATPPTGFLLCYGQAISEITYAALFAILGTAFNTGGEAAGTFRLPDLRGRIVAGLDNMGGAAASRLTGYDTRGEAGGAQEVQLQFDELPSFDLNLSVGTVSSSGFNGLVRNLVSATTTTIFEGGDDEPHPNVQPTMVMNKIIFANA